MDTQQVPNYVELIPTWRFDGADAELAYWKREAVWAKPQAILPPSPGRLAELRAMPYLDYLKSNEWLATRLCRVGHIRKCERCGSRERLEVHHRSYANLGLKEREDLEVLCTFCHGAHHGKSR